MFIKTVETASSITFASINDWANIDEMMRDHITKNFLMRCEGEMFIVDYELISTRETIVAKPVILGNTCLAHADISFNIKGVSLPIGTLLFGMKVVSVVNNMVLSSGFVHHGDYKISVMVLTEQKYFTGAVGVGASIDLCVSGVRYSSRCDHVKLVAMPIKNARLRDDLVPMTFYVDPEALSDDAWNGLEAALKYAAGRGNGGATGFTTYVKTHVTPYLPDMKSAHVIATRADFRKLAPGFYYHIQSTADKMSIGYLRTQPQKTIQSSRTDLMGLCIAHAQFVYSLNGLA